MMKIVSTAMIMLLIACSASIAADKYFDLNGTATGFGLSNTNSPYTVDPTAANWNTDPTGGSGGSLSALVSNDVAVFMISGTGDVRFDWTNASAVFLGGITSGVESGTPNIHRMQKNTAGIELIKWAPGAVVDTTGMWNSFWWNLGSTNDFTKIGGEDFYFGDGTVKVRGTLTISEGNVQVRELYTVSDLSSFRFAGAGTRFLEFDGNDSGTCTMGTLYSETDGRLAKYTGTSLANIDIVLNGGVNMTNSAATDRIWFTWGSSMQLASSANSYFDITKSGGTNYQDQIKLDWASQPFILGGGITVVLLPTSENLLPGDEFDLFDTPATITGSFSSTNLPALGSGYYWDTSLLLSDGIIKVGKKGSLFKFQ